MRSRHIHLTGIWAAAVMVLAGAAPAYAMGARASLTGGVVSVSGRAAKSAPISWEKAFVTSSNSNGVFAFTTTIVPADCIGIVGDGSSSIAIRIDGCSNQTTGLPGTGQTVTYAAGDDADVRAGGSLRYTDNRDGTVTDIRTGLTWEKKTDANVNDNYTWDTAFDYIAELNAMNGGAGFAGHNDWRLPNVKELLSIVDYGRSNPSIDPIFGPTAGKLNFVNFWSSTSWAAYNPQYNAGSVNFRDAYGDYVGMLPFGKASFLRVRAVRGGL